MTPRFRLISGGECYDRSDNECGAGRGGGPHSTWGRGDVLRELHDLYVTYTLHVHFYNKNLLLASMLYNYGTTSWG